MIDGTKMTAIDAAHSNGKAAVLAADSFAVTQNSLQGTVNAHGAAIESMAANLHSVEQQVKAMARVMASENIQRLSENMKVAREDLRRSLLFQITEKHKELEAFVEREVAEVSDTKIGIMKKIDQVESHIMTTLTAKLDEAAADRAHNTSEIEKLKEALEDFPGVAEKSQTSIRQIETKFQELKSEFRTFIADHDQENREQDKATINLTNEVRLALEAAKDKIAEETKSLSKLIHKREELLKEEVKEVKDIIEQEASQRSDSLKKVHMFISDEVDKVKVENEKKIRMIEGQQDHKVRPCIAALKEIKRTIDEEAVHREKADNELARRVAKEIQDRHQDEERLVSLISTCQDAVGKLHKA